MKLRTALLGAVAVIGLTNGAYAERGADGEVKLTFPQAVSVVNPYLSGGTKQKVNLVLTFMFDSKKKTSFRRFA